MNRLFLFVPIIIFFVVSLGLFTSCKKSTEDIVVINSLIGIWRPNNTTVEVKANGDDLVDYLVSNFSYTEAEAQDYYDDFVADYFQNVGGSISFNGEKNYYLTLNSKEEENGTWSVSADGLFLYMTFDGVVETLNILEISANSLIVHLPSEQENADIDGDGFEETTLSIFAERSYSKNSNGGMGG